MLNHKLLMYETKKFIKKAAKIDLNISDKTEIKK